MGINKKDGFEYILKLFVSGSSPNSIRAISNLQKILMKHLDGRYSLHVIDLHQEEKSIAGIEQIIAVPMLIKKFPLPERRLIGDMSDTQKVLDGLGIFNRVTDED
ncbi:MAG TPA: circadian clock KaiB family protein [Ohtaekwangia sp.]